MPRPPAVVVYDVNETLSDMSAMAGRFVEIGAPAHLARTWFASVLRDGFAVAAAGSAERFAVVAAHALRSVLADAVLNRPVDEAVDHVLRGMSELDLHPDVAGAVRQLQAAGVRQVTLTNGAAAVADSLLTRAGLRDAFEQLLTVEDAGGWKPSPVAYQHAVTATGCTAQELVLVAVHPWDVHGAARAGLRTVWVDRTGTDYPGYLAPPETTVRSLAELADRIGGGTGS